MQINTQLNEFLSSIAGERFREQIKEDIGTAMIERARTGTQKSQRLNAQVHRCQEVNANTEEEDSRYIHALCTSNRRSFARLIR